MSGHVVEVPSAFSLDSVKSDSFRQTRCGNSFEKDQACSQIISGIDTTFCIDIGSFIPRVIAIDWEGSILGCRNLSFCEFHVLLQGKVLEVALPVCAIYFILTS